MSKSEDVNTLYRRFGGNAGTYQEIGANEMAGAATRRWPILGELRPQAHREAPDARKGNTAIGERQVGSFLTPAGGAVNAPPMPEDVGSVAIADEASVAVPQSLPVMWLRLWGQNPWFQSLFQSRNQSRSLSLLKCLWSNALSKRPRAQSGQRAVCVPGRLKLTW
jgi:hypothetical protein